MMNGDVTWRAAAAALAFKRVRRPTAESRDAFIGTPGSLTLPVDGQGNPFWFLLPGANQTQWLKRRQDARARSLAVAATRSTGLDLTTTLRVVADVRRDDRDRSCEKFFAPRPSSRSSRVTLGLPAECIGRAPSGGVPSGTRISRPGGEFKSARATQIPAGFFSGTHLALPITSRLLYRRAALNDPSMLNSSIASKETDRR